MLDGNETEQRICRSCNRSYAYPLLKSVATRFYCAACMELDPPVREAFELLNKRINTLTEQMGQLTKNNVS